MFVAHPHPTARWDMVDGPMPRGLLGVGDPDVHCIDGVTTMFLGGFSSTFRNRLYRATLADGDDPGGDRWSIDTDHRGRARALAADPPRRGWDAAGMHTPSYVAGNAARPPRLYYTGRATSRQYGRRSRYAIGVLEQHADRWQRHTEPVIVGDDDRRSVLEPLVVHDGERYLMWFQANRHEIGPAEHPDYQLRVATSADGLRWSAPQVFADTGGGFFDNAVARVGDRWVMVLARGANLHGTAGFPEQGLWVSTTTDLSPDPSDWSTPVRVLDTDTDSTPDWLGRGCYGPSLLATDDGGAVAHVTGVRPTPRWPRLVLEQVLRHRRLVVPSPFYLGLGAVRLSKGRDGSLTDR